MLTRYKQLYNALTHSEAFKAEGRMDNSKINKKKFTPHNLKALIIGGNGAIAFYYTTNDLDGKLVRPISITCPLISKVTGQMDPQKYQEWVKEDKGMIDALIDGLKFNYIEEIIFFTGGFITPEELNKEYARVIQFCSNSKSMSRLMGVYMVEGSLSNDLCSFTTDKSLKQQMQEHNIPCNSLMEYKPERTELGLLTNRGLNSLEYEMDKKFSPNLADKEKVKVDYRLSRYFYNQEQQAIKEKKRQEEEKKETECDEMLLKAVDSTIEKLDKFYAPLWGGKYSGIIYKGDVSFSKANTINKIKSLTKVIYEAWATFALKNLDSCDIANTKIEYGKGYLPGFHVESLKSKENWDKRKLVLRRELLKKYSEHFEKEPEKINELDRGLTNCLVIRSRSKNQLILQMTGILEKDLDSFKAVFDEMTSKAYLGSATKGLIADTALTDGILSLTYIIDYNAFLNEVLFAYKQYNDGFKPSLSSALVGLKMNGMPLTVNLIDPRKMLTTIIAGSRSGKGTMTMGLLASIFGAGGSVVYLDNKPDIGAMLWNLERDYANQGLKLLSIDMGSEIQEFSGATPIRTGGMNLISEDREESSLFRTLRLAKLFQLVSFIGSNSLKIKTELGLNPQNLFFIADEMTVTNIDYTKLCLYVEKRSKDFEGKANKAKATDREKELAAYYSKLNNILTKTPDNLTKGFNKDFGQSGVKIIVIGQQ